jgi:hypothetical protein
MSVTQQDIDNLNAAIASGERVVVLNGQSVTYRAIGDLITARNDLERQLAKQNDAAAGVQRPKQRYGYHAGRGY